MLGLPGDFDWGPCNVVVVGVVINVSVVFGCGREFLAGAVVNVLVGCGGLGWCC